ncbi:MAG TPA: Ig-like domain-containing protein [Gemmatimonadaceae bacterium]|nr:Ig-like domain-containing protein [Gemmatimonadaceae bacterium]
MQPCRAWRSLVAVSLALLSTCTTSVDPTAVAVVTLVPPSDSARIGETRQIEAQLFDANNNRLQGRRIHWRSNDPAVATVDTLGVLRGIAVGTTVIVATVEGKSGQAQYKIIAPVNRVAVAPLTADIPLGSNRQLAANVLDAAGNAIAGRPVTWSSSNSTIATVSVGGLVSAVALGRVTITATAEGKSGTSTIDVVDPTASVRITPAGPQILRVGGKVQLTATALNAAGQPLPGRTVNWVSSNPNVASVNSTTGEVTAVAVGQAAITAEIEGRQAQASVTVTLIPVSSVSLAPTSLTMFRGEQRQLTLTSTDSTGATITNYQGRAVNYNSNNLPVASVSPAGVVFAADTGTAVVNASVDNVFSNNVTVTVRLVPIDNITVNPNPASVKVGNTQQFTATLRDSNGNIIVGRPVVWSSSDTNKATITAAGVLTGITTGTLTVTATAEGVVGTASVTITP